MSNEKKGGSTTALNKNVRGLNSKMLPRVTFNSLPSIIIIR